MPEIILVPIGAVHSSRKAVLDDGWDAETSAVRLDATRFSPDALAGLEAFSHVEIVFFMDQVDPARIETGARHPRNDATLPKVGIFAQRGKNRPNQIGTTVCRVDRVEGLDLHVKGLDAVDGTPVLDIKPWVNEFGARGFFRQPGWMSDLMKAYW